MTLRNYSTEQLKEAISTSISVREVLAKLQLVPAGGNYLCFHKLVKTLNIDISHFKGQGHNKNKVFGPKRPLDAYLSNKHCIQSHKLRQRLLYENIKEHKCENCLHTTWIGNPIPLELEHIDGDHLNNSLENLKLLCPNCHSLTPTYRGKNKGKKTA